MLNSKVSIIVPAYNCNEFLAETLDSVLAQTYQDWECIIVNDGSTDNTITVAKKYASTDSRIKYLSQDNQGPSVARNIAIAHSSGEYILPLDGDDIIAPTYLEKAIRYFEEHPNTKLVYCRATFFGEKVGLWELPTYDYDCLLWNNIIFNSAIYKRFDYDKTIGYNPNMNYGLEDWDFWLSLLSPKDKVHRIDEALFFYRIKQKSRNENNTLRHLEEMRVQIVKNHRETYLPFLERIINQTMEIEESKELLAYYKKELENTKASKAYRFGRIVLAPLRWTRTHILQ